MYTYMYICGLLQPFWPKGELGKRKTHTYAHSNVRINCGTRELRMHSINDSYLQSLLNKDAILIGRYSYQMFCNHVHIRTYERAKANAQPLT